MENLLVVLQSPLYNLLFIMVILWSTGILFERFKLPLIIGELLAGVILGPAVLNWVRQTPIFFSLAQLGMFFLMFYAGLENNPQDLRKNAKDALSVGFWGSLFPFVLIMLVIFFAGGNLAQALLIGAALCSTSMVTKTRILDDLNILKTRMGITLSGAGVVDTVFSFMILSIVVKSVQNNGFHLFSVISTISEVALFFLITITIGILILPRVGKLFTHRRGKGFTFALIMGLFFAVLAESIHLPFILGAYLAGLFVREEIMSKNLFQKMNDRFLAISHGFLGPIFIMSVALRVNFGVVLTQTWLLFYLFLAAFIGKLAGTYVGGTLSNHSERESLCMGLGMNGRGATELVLALIGVELGVISNLQLSIIVLVSFVTTLLAPLLLRRYLKTFKNEIGVAEKV